MVHSLDSVHLQLKTKTLLSYTLLSQLNIAIAIEIETFDHLIFIDIIIYGILSKANPDPDPDLQKKRTLLQNSRYELNTRF